MAKIIKQSLPGLLFGISGTMGGMVYTSWKGKPGVRSKPKKSSTPPTRAQEAQRLRFALVNKCLLPARSLINLGFRSAARHMTELNMAASLALKNAITGAFPDYQIDYSRLLLSQGALCRGEAAEVEALGNELIRFTWADYSFGDWQRSADKAVLIALCPEAAVCVHAIGEATRSHCMGLLHAKGLGGKKVHTYLSFFSADGKKVSSSVYSGEVLIL
ncbi:MAG TPA: DUF6266 family protein [Chitinophagaceae bacterium]|jgi:hypothetical protein